MLSSSPKETKVDFSRLRSDDGTYYTPKNGAISVSKAKDFLESKSYYKGRWVDGTVKDDPTPSMLLGMMVDAAFTEGSVEAIGKFFAHKGEGGRIASTPAVIEKARAIAQQLLGEEFYGFYRTHRCVFQPVLFGRMGGASASEKFEICGKPDVVSWDGKTVYVDDLKIVAPSKMRDAKAWAWNCRDMKYFMQFGVYRHLVKENLTAMGLWRGTRVVTRHIAVSSLAVAGRHRVALYEVPEALCREQLELFRKTGVAIKKERLFADNPVRWDDIVKLSDPAGDSEEETDEE